MTERTYKNTKRGRWIKQQIANGWKESYGCVDCKKKYPSYVLDFDHKDDSEKCFNVSWAVNQNVSIDRLVQEIMKCDIRCANCHRERTWNRGEKVAATVC